MTLTVATYTDMIQQRHERRGDACNIHPHLRRFKKLWKTKLTWQAVSGDESDHANGQKILLITDLSWRSKDPKVITFFRTFDHIHLSDRFNSTGRAGRGQFPHPRVPSRRKERHSNPVPGLPENFYDADFLDDLDHFERKALKIQPAIDLTFTPEVQRFSLYHHYSA
jgi:hypothetical protein